MNKLKSCFLKFFSISAYLSMIETPASANVWINDPEISPVLSQISKTYHTEKHTIHMNRYT